MADTEKIPVYIWIKNGKTICVCHAGRRGCGRPCCERDEVTRDVYRGWEEARRRNRYGQ